MPSAAGKRVGRVLAGCSKPEAVDKPGLLSGSILGSSRHPCIGQHECPPETPPESEVTQDGHDTIDAARTQNSCKSLNHPFPASGPAS